MKAAAIVVFMFDFSLSKSFIKKFRSFTSIKRNFNYKKGEFEFKNLDEEKNANLSRERFQPQYNGIKKNMLFHSFFSQKKPNMK